MAVDVERYSPAARADSRLEAAIARRNTAWSNYQAAHQLLRAAESRYAGAELAPYLQNYNVAQDEWEHAVRDLVKARVAWRSDTGRDLVTGRLPSPR